MIDDRSRADRHDTHKHTTREEKVKRVFRRGADADTISGTAGPLMRVGSSRGTIIRHRPRKEPLNARPAQAALEPGRRAKPTALYLSVRQHNNDNRDPRQQDQTKHGIYETTNNKTATKQTTKTPPTKPYNKQLVPKPPKSHHTNTRHPGHRHQPPPNRRRLSKPRRVYTTSDFLSQLPMLYVEEEQLARAPQTRNWSSPRTHRKPRERGYGAHTKRTHAYIHGFESDHIYHIRNHARTT